MTRNTYTNIAASFCRLAIVLVVSLFITNHTLGQNLVSNGDFEQGPTFSTDHTTGWAANGPTGWVATKPSPDRIYAGSTVPYRDNAPAQSGKAYAEFDGTAQESGKIALTDSLYPGYTYELEYFMDIDDYFFSTNGCIKFSFQNGQDSVVSPQQGNTGKWERHYITFHVTKATKELEIIALGGSLVKLDNLSIQKKQLLPVTLTHFDGNVLENSTIKLNFVYDGDAFDTYVIERAASNDGTFSPIGLVEQGSTSSYNFTDNQPLVGKNIYRIRLEGNGEMDYSQSIFVLYNVNGVDVASYYNASNSKVNIRTASDHANTIVVSVVNVNNGQVVAKETVRQERDNSEYELPLPSLSQGTYVIQVYFESDNGERERFNSRFVKW